MLQNRVIVGSLTNPTITFDNATISEVGGVFSVDVIGNQLSIDTVQAAVRHDPASVGIYIPADANERKQNYLRIANQNALAGTQRSWTTDGRSLTATMLQNATSSSVVPNAALSHFCGTVWVPAGEYTFSVSVSGIAATNLFLRVRYAGGTTVDIPNGSTVALSEAAELRDIRSDSYTYAAGLTYDVTDMSLVNSAFGIYLTADDKVYILADVALRSLPYGTPVWWFNENVLMMAGFLRSVERTAKAMYRLNVVSGVGLLDAVFHAGGIYTGQTFSEVVADIVGGAFAYSVGDAVKNLAIYGWLPYATRRENLHQLLFATGVSLRKDRNGNPTFVFLSSQNPAAVPDSRIAYGGEVNYESPASGVEVTEHSYYASADDEVVTEFDNTNGSAAASTKVVFYDAPLHDLTTTGTLTIEESNCNYAIVSGVGALSGKMYTHTTRIVTQSAASPTENIKRVTDMTLVSLVNSLNVAKRVLAYYSSSKTVRAKISLSGEKCGDNLALNDPYEEPMTAFLAGASVNASTNLLAQATLIEGYTPTGQGNNVSGSETLTGSGTWVSPLTGEITVVVIGGGTGGGSGEDGEDQPEVQITTETTQFTGYLRHIVGVLAENCVSGKGGAGGAGGAGGKVLMTTISVAEGQSIAYSCGAGGAGAAQGSDQGSAGGDTTFGAVSSANGEVPESGFVNPISGDILATTGDTGADGMNGVGYEIVDGVATRVIPDPITADGNTYSSGPAGTSAQDAQGRYNAGLGFFDFFASGGLGGGAAVGANGNTGGNGSGLIASDGSNPIRAAVSIAPGGNGADASAPAQAAVYGRGGKGGNGGGGAGACGYPNYAGNTYTNTGGTISASATLGDGGSGSIGGQGGDGCVLIFY